MKALSPFLLVSVVFYLGFCEADGKKPEKILMVKKNTRESDADVYTPGDLRVRSRIECATECLRDPFCVASSYNRETRDCLCSCDTGSGFPFGRESANGWSRIRHRETYPSKLAYGGPIFISMS